MQARRDSWPDTVVGVVAAWPGYRSRGSGRLYLSLCPARGHDRFVRTGRGA